VTQTEDAKALAADKPNSWYARRLV